MSLTSYRAAPPRVGNWANGEGRIANGDGLRPFAIRPSRFAFSCVEEEPPVLCRPGDDLLSRVLRQSTIGAEAFDGRVRDGIGSYRLAESHQAGKERLGLKQKGLFWGGEDGSPASAAGSREETLPTAGRRIPTAVFKLFEYENNQAERAISTGKLNALPRLHTRPINVVVFHGSSGRTRFEAGFPLRCLQRLSIPYIATLHCGWRHNRSTRDTFTPVLSY